MTSKVVYVNANGLRSKFGRFVQWMRAERPALVCVVEVKSLGDSPFIGKLRGALPQYQVEYYPVRARSGGILVLGRVHFASQLLFSGRVRDSTQVVLVELWLGTGLATRVVAVYRSPSSKDWDSWWDIVRQQSADAAPLLVIGDFNAPLSPTGAQDSALGDRMEAGAAVLGLTNLNRRFLPGQPTHDRGNMLDVGYANRALQGQVESMSLSWRLGSDHAAVVVVMKGRQSSVPKDLPCPWRIGPHGVDWEALQDLIEYAADETVLLDQNQADNGSAGMLEQWELNFTRMLGSIMPVFFRRRAVSRWSVVGKEPLKVLRKEASVLSRQISRTKNAVTRKGLVERRRAVRTQLELALRGMLRHKQLAALQDACAGRSVSWQDILRLVPTQVVLPTPSAVRSASGQVPAGVKDSINNLADAFADYSKPPPSSDSVLTARADAFVRELDERLEWPGEPLEEVTLGEVKASLQSLHETMAPGADGVPEAVFKHLPQRVLGSIAAIFTLSLRLGVVPRAWKHSIVSPHFKKGDPGAASSWRPVANPHPLLKTLGRVVQRRYQARFAECVSEWLCPRAIHERAVPAVDAVSSRCHREQVLPTSGICGYNPRL